MKLAAIPDAREEGARAVFVARGDAPPVLDARKTVFDFVPTPVEGLAVRLSAPCFFGGMQGSMPLSISVLRKASLS
jgi:hypothetical protein